MRQILLSLVILRLAEESSLSANKLHWSVPLQDPSPTAQDDKMIVQAHAGGQTPPLRSGGSRFYQSRGLCMSLP